MTSFLCKQLPPPQEHAKLRFYILRYLTMKGHPMTVRFQRNFALILAFTCGLALPAAIFACEPYRNPFELPEKLAQKLATLGPDNLIKSIKANKKANKLCRKCLAGPTSESQEDLLSQINKEFPCKRTNQTPDSATSENPNNDQPETISQCYSEESDNFDILSGHDVDDEYIQNTTPPSPRSHHQESFNNKYPSINSDEKPDYSNESEDSNGECDSE